MARAWNADTADDPGPTLTVAQASLREFAKWIDESSRSGISPLGHPVTPGPFASITPTAFDEVPDTAFGEGSLPLAVPIEQTRLVGLPAPDRGDALGQRTGPFARLGHLMFMARDDTTVRAGHAGRFDFALIPLDDGETLGDAIAIHAAGIDLNVTLVLGVPLSLFAGKERDWLELKLPMLPMTV